MTKVWFKFYNISLTAFNFLGCRFLKTICLELFFSFERKREKKEIILRIFCVSSHSC